MRANSSQKPTVKSDLTETCYAPIQPYFEIELIMHPVSIFMYCDMFYRFWQDWQNPK